MKIGILTFHSQLNYGGVLQCWALKEALKGMGHNVVVIDRWLDERNVLLKGVFAHFSLRQWLGVMVRGLLGCGHLSFLLRRIRTMRFVKKLGLTSYSFCDWKDAPKDLGVECIVVGSDQVWHGGDWGNPLPYLLDGAPSLPAIAYAASFGMKELPQEIDYCSGFRRFKAISVRELEGIDLVEGTGYENVVQHVVDPTLLLVSEQWRRMGNWRKVPRRVVCYFLSEDVEKAIQILEPWARKKNYSVEILCDERKGAVPRSFREFGVRLNRMFCSCLPVHRTHLRTSYGPIEFVRAFAQAEMVITDSFHAVMFASIYGCNLRFLKPMTEFRKRMFSRVEEFARDLIVGDLFVENLSAALFSFDKGVDITFRQDIIARSRKESARWLMKALEACK